MARKKKNKTVNPSVPSVKEDAAKTTKGIDLSDLSDELIKTLTTGSRIDQERAVLRWLSPPD